MPADSSRARLASLLQAPWQWEINARMPGMPFEVVAHARHRRWSAANSHSHPYREVLVALQGSTVYSRDGAPYACRPGVIMLFDAMEPHDSSYPPFSPQVEHLWISFVGDHCLARTVSVRNGRLTTFPGLTLALPNEPEMQCLDRSWSGLPGAASTASAAALMSARLTAALLLLLSRVAEEDHAEQSAQREAVQRKAVTAVQEHIARTAGKADCLDTLARTAGYSKYHFLRLFKKHTGQTVHEYVDDCRRKLTADLLARGTPKKHIAFTLGFSCPSAFSRWYRQKALNDCGQGTCRNART